MENNNKKVNIFLIFVKNNILYFGAPIISKYTLHSLCIVALQTGLKRLEVYTDTNLIESQKRLWK